MNLPTLPDGHNWIILDNGEHRCSCGWSPNYFRDIGLTWDEQVALHIKESSVPAISGVVWHQGEDTPVRDDKLTFWVVTEQGFPHGLSCMECDRGIEIGQPYRDRLNGMFSDGIPLNDLVCVYC